MSVRKIGVKTSSVSLRFFSLKMQRLISTESLLEAHYCFLWELCPKIIYYCEQPITLEYKNLKYTPDFELNFGKLKILVEIKPTKHLDKILFKIKNLENYFIKFSYDYFLQIFLFSEKDLHSRQVKHLKDVYFQLLNSISQDILRLLCPFTIEDLTSKESMCPIRNKLFEISSAFEAVQGSLCLLI